MSKANPGISAKEKRMFFLLSAGRFAKKRAFISLAEAIPPPEGGGGGEGYQAEPDRLP